MSYDPKTFYSGKFGTLTVTTELQENAARAAGFEEKKPYQEYPRIMHHATKGTKIVNSDEDKSALGKDWHHQSVENSPEQAEEAEPIKETPTTE